MKARLGIAPIAWWNDDMAELSDDVSLRNACGKHRLQVSPAWKPAVVFQWT